MSENSSRFTAQNQMTHDRVVTNTVGLVALSDFRKRRAEVLEQQEREASEAAYSGTSTPTNHSVTGTPDNAGSESGGAKTRPVKKQKPKKKAQKLLSFGDDEEEENGDDAPVVKPKTKSEGVTITDSEATNDVSEGETKKKVKANAAVGIIPKTMTKSALRKEAAEREALRREFLSLQEAVKATEIALPFVFYDGTNIPGGTVRVKKGDFIWVFLDKSRKVGAELGVGEKSNARREWARVGVDDLMLVRGTVIIPHHYDFHYFIVNKSAGPGGQRLFEYSAERPKKQNSNSEDDSSTRVPLQTAASKAAAAKALPDVSTLEGANDDPTLTKVVDRRWYERNKHIYPASTWQDFDSEKDYSAEVRRDGGGNTFFFSR